MSADQTIAESSPVKRGRANKFVIGGLVIAAAIVYLVISAAKGATAYYLTIRELASQQTSTRQVRVVGNVIGSSIDWSPEEMLLKFEITDDSGTLPVVYHGARPDMLRATAQVVVEGRYLGGSFEAKTLLLKCPSKYEADPNG
jgi:cytochrome c-type biogenesis protein CcmE